MMNRWNCRPKQKRGKSKRAERSIGFSPLIPAKQVHTGGNPFFISVTDIHTVSFGNTPLYLSAAPYSFISMPTHAKAASPLCFKAASGHFSFTSSFPHFSCRIETATSIRCIHLLSALRLGPLSTMQRTWLYKRYIVLAASTPNNRYAFLPDVLPAHLPERERSCVSGRTGLSCLRIRCGLFRLDFFATAFYLKSPYRFSLQS